MNAKRCDRCGKYYESEGTGTVTVTVKHGEDSTKISPYIGIYTKEAERHIHDLCEECAKDFEKWMKQDNGNT